MRFGFRLARRNGGGAIGKTSTEPFCIFNQISHLVSVKLYKFNANGILNTDVFMNLLRVRVVVIGVHNAALFTSAINGI